MATSFYRKEAKEAGTLRSAVRRYRKKNRNKQTKKKKKNRLEKLRGLVRTDTSHTVMEAREECEKQEEKEKGGGRAGELHLVHR